MSIETILIVDDELLIRDFLAETLKRKKYRVELAENVSTAKKKLKRQPFDLVITDMKMPDGTGLDVLREIKEHSCQTLSIVITAFGSVQNAVEAMKLGAWNYIIKPFSPDAIETLLEKAKQHAMLVHENHYLKTEREQLPSQQKKGIIAQSPIMQSILQQAKKIAQSHAHVFLTGESGTGKEVVASFIHRESPRATFPYICVNCAAIPETLLESEFFGHEKGAFTGATQKKLGRFELANQGTILLDEVTEIPLSMQSKLLRAIQEKKFERVGGTHCIETDVRFISTSNRCLQEAVQQKQFREDLYYRLNVIPLRLPPLRKRQEDILALAHYFLETFCQQNKKTKKAFSPSAKKKLQQYHWPGNIRELANVIERVVVIDLSKEIEAEHLYLDSALQPVG